MDIIISSLELAVANAVDLLTRSRLKKGGSFYLVKPRKPLRITIAKRTPGLMEVLVRCGSWDDGHTGSETLLKLSLSEYNDVWLPWGWFSVTYGAHYPVTSLARGSVARAMYPMFADNPDAVRHQELRIRSRM